MFSTARRRTSCLIALLVGCAGASPIAQAGQGKLFGGDLIYNGQFRLETAISTSGEASGSNQFGDPANGVAVMREPGNPATGYTTVLQPGGNLTGPSGVIPIGLTPVNDTVIRYVPGKNPLMNYHALRFESSASISWGDISLVSRLRAMYDPGELGYDDFDYRDYQHINGGITGGEPQQFHGEPSHFGYRVDGEKKPLWFEYSGRNYMVDLPAFFLQWTNGNATVRLGNQSVAWGQLLFFRVMDVANGLDLRRHLFLDRAIEEFADERMSAPGLRFSYQVTDKIYADAFAQQFVPTILNNVNTPYNIVPSQFTLHDRYHQEGFNEKVNFGVRFKAEYGTYNWQAMVTRRYNPLGAIRWAKSGVNKALPDSNALGAAFNNYCILATAANGYPSNNGCGPLLADTAFEVAPAGVFSAEEWFNYAGYIKLDGLDALDRAIDEFTGAQLLLAQPVNRNVDAANNQLDAFFVAAEGLRGHIERRYFQETIVGIGGGFVVTNAEPGSLLDQLIINLETTYAKDRKFTAIDLRQDYTERDEYQIGLVMEKYHRFSQEFPATYMVFQYLWQKESDLAGLLLDGYGSENFTDQGVILNDKVPTSANPTITPGISEGANYVVLAALQPTDAYIWEYSVAALIDVQGGMLVQPGIQWKPRGNITVNMFYNYINGDLWGGNTNKNLFSLIDFMDEFSLRLGFQF